MNQSFEKSLAYANRMKVFNNQLRLLKEKYLEKNTYYTKGHQFTIDLHLINHCLALKNLHKQNTVLLDDYQIPVQIEDIDTFYNDIMDVYQRNLNSYLVEYNKLVKEKGEVKRCQKELYYLPIIMIPLIMWHRQYFAVKKLKNISNFQ